MWQTVTNCTEVDGGIFEHIWQTVTNCTEVDGGIFLTYMTNCKKFVVSVNQICRLNIKLKTKLTVSNSRFFVAIHNALYS